MYADGGRPKAAPTANSSGLRIIKIRKIGVPLSVINRIKRNWLANLKIITIL